MHLRQLQKYEKVIGRFRGEASFATEVLASARSHSRKNCYQQFSYTLVPLRYVVAYDESSANGGRKSL